jgi:hypothetical protein
MAGDQAGGAAALKTALGGQDINAMNAFQKQALSQATGMGIQELMQLTQSKGGGVKGSLEERNALKTGKAIAQGALSQDISNAAAKLALDQKNRAEMLKFEQAKRLAMLFIEQKFRLTGIEREFKYREQRERQSAEQSIATAQMDLVKEVASQQIMQGTRAYSGALGAGKFDATKVVEYQAKLTAQYDDLGKLMADNKLSPELYADITMAIQKAAAKGTLLNLDKYTKGTQFLPTAVKPTLGGFKFSTVGSGTATATGGGTTTATAGGGGVNTTISPTMSDAQAQTKLQSKMVDLLATSATILQYILVKEQPNIQIDKMTLSRKLLNTAHTQFAIAGLPK